MLSGTPTSIPSMVHSYLTSFLFSFGFKELSAKMSSSFGTSFLPSAENIRNYIIIDLNRRDHLRNIFLISPWKHMLWYSLEVPCWGTSNEYTQHMFSWRNKKRYSLEVPRWGTSNHEYTQHMFSRRNKKNINNVKSKKKKKKKYTHKKKLEMCPHLKNLNAYF